MCGIILLLIIGIVIITINKKESLALIEDNSINLRGIISQQGSHNSNNTLNISYEFLDDGKVTHIWNTKYDYYFNTSSGIQFTNHYEDYWTKNIFCIGYYNNEIWNKIYCADELSSFNKKIETDNLTYVNATLWKDIEYGVYDLRLGIQYHLGEIDAEQADENLTITIYGKNMDTKDIPYDLGFAWKVQDVNIPGLGEDYITINETEYSLNDTFDLTFKDINESFYNIHDLTKYLRLDWNNNLDYKVKMYGDGNQSTFYTALLINAGQFSAGQEKKTILNWIDADTSIETEVLADLDRRGVFGPYWYSTSVGEVIYLDNTADLYHTRTTDGGVTWAETSMGSTGPLTAYAVWFDQETPGDTGDLIHVVWADFTDSVFYYTPVDLSDGSIGTTRIINNTLTVDGAANSIFSGITKTVSGNLIAGITTQAGTFTFKSTDDGVTWSSIADIFELGTEADYILLYPANTTDDDDVAGIFWDKNVATISLKMYDDSANTWTETTLSSGMYTSYDKLNMDGVVRHSDGHILMGAWDRCDSVRGDILTWDLTVDSIASPTITAKTNVIGFFGRAESCQVAMLINQQTDDIFLASIDGNPTYYATTDVVYSNSTNGMTTWNGQQGYPYSETTDDIRLVHGGRTIGDNGGRMQWVFNNDDLTELFVNLVNDIEIAAATEVDNSPTITLSSPTDDTSNTIDSYSFLCNVTDDYNITNTTLWIWNSTGVWNNTVINISTGTSLNYTFSTLPTLSIENYTWNCLSYDNATQSNWATANFSLNVTPDTCTPTSPLSANYQFECSDNCVLKTALDANGFNVTINGTGTFELQENIYNWIYLRLMGESATKRCFIHCSGGKCFTR